MKANVPAVSRQQVVNSKIKGGSGNMSVEKINLVTIPVVRAAAVAMLAAAIDLRNGGDEDEYGRKSGEAIDACIARLGMPANTQKLTPRQRDLDETVMETIQDLALAMEKALVKARLLPKEN